VKDINYIKLILDYNNYGLEISRIKGNEDLSKMDSRFLSRRVVIMSLLLWDREKLSCDQKLDL